MSFLSDVVDTVGGWFGNGTLGSTIGSKFGDDWMSWLKPIASAGLGYLGNQNNSNMLNNMYQAMANAEQQDYANQSAERDNYLAWLQGQQAIDQANAASRARAERAGIQEQIKAAKEARSYFEPYRKTGLKVLPKMTEAYLNGLSNLGLLSNILTGPNSSINAKLGPMWESNIPLPDYMKKGK